MLYHCSYCRKPQPTAPCDLCFRALYCDAECTLKDTERHGPLCNNLVPLEPLLPRLIAYLFQNPFLEFRGEVLESVTEDTERHWKLHLRDETVTNEDMRVYCHRTWPSLPNEHLLHMYCLMGRAEYMTMALLAVLDQALQSLPLRFSFRGKIIQGMVAIKVQVTTPPDTYVRNRVTVSDMPETFTPEDPLHHWVLGLTMDDGTDWCLDFTALQYGITDREADVYVHVSEVTGEGTDIYTDMGKIVESETPEDMRKRLAASMDSKVDAILNDVIAPDVGMFPTFASVVMQWCANQSVNA